VTECPACKFRLEPGYVELRNTFIDFFAYGWSYLVLTFTDGSSYDYDVIDPARRNVAASCAQCGAVVITDEPWVA
jgi:hypothetical protein